MKKIIKLFGYTSIIVTAVFIFRYFDMNTKNEEEVFTAFSHSYVSPLQLNLNIRGNLSNEQSVMSFIKNISNTMKTNAELQKSITGDITTYQKRSTNKIIKIIVRNKESDNAKPYVVVDVTLFSNYKEVSSISNTVQKVFKNYNTTPSITILMVGNFSGKLDKLEMARVVNTVYNELKAKKVERYEDAYQLGYTGYSSKLISNLCVNSGREKVNLDIRLRYNDYENKTYLYLAAPIIEIET